MRHPQYVRRVVLAARALMFVFVTAGLACPATCAAGQGGPLPEKPATPAAAEEPGDFLARARSSLLQGVSEIAAPGVPGPLAVMSPTSGAVVLGGFRTGAAPVVAAGVLGKGRVVAFGHTGYLSADTLKVGDTGRLLANALRWVSTETDAAPEPKAAPGEVLVIDNRELAEHIRSEGWRVATARPADVTADRLSSVRVLVIGQGSITPSVRTAVVAASERGMGLVIGGLGWGWLQLNPGKTLQQHPGNMLLRDAGIAWADGTLERTGQKGYIAPAADGAQGQAGPDGAGVNIADRELHAGSALDLLMGTRGERSAKPGKTDKGQVRRLKQASASVELAAVAAQDDDPYLRPRLAALMAERGDGLSLSADSPMGPERGLDRVLLTLQLRELESQSSRGAAVAAHPAAAAFPGAVGEGAERITRTLEIDSDAHGWRSTGLYAPPGGTIRLTMSDADASAAKKAGVRVQIGAHDDRNFHHEKWTRSPSVVVSRPLDGPSVEITSAFGGLIYIDVPAARGNGQPARGGRSAWSGSVTVAGAVESPRFVLGRTTPQAWAMQRVLAERGEVPWAEFESGKIILTVPSSIAASVEDPAELMTLWDRIADSQADLAQISRERPRPERFVADQQISAGYMHAGYPIMTHLDAAAFMTNAADLQAGRNAWGLFHELGHNHQSPLWTFDGTGEVTVNLFTMYTLETVCGVPVGDGWWWKEEDRQRLIVRHLRRDKASFEKWKGDPSTALIMYIQMQRAFGWETYKRVFAEYRDLPDAEKPRGEQAERDQWMERFSRATGRNLGPFFQAWGVPTSDEARARVADLEPWMPEGFPPGGG
ncbi:MAG: M60 family metallopeptidase [Phycisphaerales bacterium]|nr:M60 family metallopeptidase [Phycisphaeraceae bacterium]